MTRPLRKCLFAPLLIAAALTGEAALHWPRPEVQLFVSAGTEEVAVAFPFENPGLEPVTFSSLRTDCGCTTAETTKLTYGPGESGHIEVRFRPGERIGALERTVEARTTSGSTAYLKLRIQITDPITTSSRVLSWEVSPAPTAQSVELDASGGPDIVQIGIDGAIDRTLEIRVVCLEPGRRYRLEVIPRISETPFDVAFSCRARFSDGAERNLTIRAVAEPSVPLNREK